MTRHEYISSVPPKWWHCINEHFAVTIHFRQVSRTRLQIEDGNTQILLPRNCLPEHFVYEIARLYLLAKGWHITDYLVIRFQKQPLLDWILSDNLFCWVGSQLEALILLPLLQQNRISIYSLHQDFISIGNSPMACDQLEIGFAQQPLRSHTIALFIQQFFVMNIAMYFYSNLQPLQQRLAGICSSLFSQLQSFTTVWNNLAAEEFLADASIYKPPLKDFIDTLGGWCLNHSFTHVENNTLNSDN